MATSGATQTQAELSPSDGSLSHRAAALNTNDTILSVDEAIDNVLEASRLADSTVPDGGPGWIVIVACAVVSFWFTGVNYSWGVTQAAFVESGLSSASTLSFIGSIPPTIISAMAIINSRIVRIIGARSTAMIGIGVIFLAQLTSSFTVTNLAGLFVTAGAMLGCGMSLCFTTCSVTPAQYFKQKRGLANGIVFAGGGLGGATVTIMQGVLIQHVGVAWTYRIMALATLATGMPAAWMIKERIRVPTIGFVDWSLFKDTRFALIFVAGAIATFPLLVPPFFLPLYSHSLGLSPNTGAALLAGFNFSSAAGRILCGFVSDKLGPLNTLFGSLVVSSLGMLVLWPTSTTLAPLAVFTVLNGTANGGFFATIPTAVGNVFGSVRVAVALGMIVTGWGGGYLMGAPIAGYLLNAYGGEKAGLEAYRPAMYYAGSLSLASAGLIALMRLRMAISLGTRL
ncbi:monocarboxylate permease [Pochonia chlamydosporia 170]|uniref:Monocarboxylate permease n=1 Tax=Pochonia chlamydosporia 170 TaxID=1380566 RepID=A0A179G6K3_METCM|nr:monocarboxylate permease [Pochonia chlamydosporia 170]OAQ73140.1 monocarboxylate permease [Pochonia chlamydosporia 170]